MIIKIVDLNYSSTPTIFHEFKMIDTIRDFSLTIEPGKIYGLVGSIGSGGWLLSYILAGREVHSLMDQIYSNSMITIDAAPINNEYLQKIACYIGEGVADVPYKKYNRYPLEWTWRIRSIKTVADQITEGIRISKNVSTLKEIAEMFDLSGYLSGSAAIGRINRPLEFNSGERWRASLAIGYAYQKKLYCSPWIEPHGIEYLLGSHGRRYLKILKDSGASVLLPVSSEKYVSGIADEIIYLNQRHIEERCD